jgi:N-acetylglucosamine-6-phosphate deacetylase
MTQTMLALGPQGFGPHRVTWEGRHGPTLTPTKVSAKAAKELEILAPGFVDMHIHGAFGVDFMTATRADFSQALERLWATQGYEKLLPTTVTAPSGVVADFLARLPKTGMIAGVHLEGPFISPKYPGAQPPSAIEAPPTGPSAWDPILDDGRVRVLTMAPELPGGIELIRRLAARGVRVGMGHTNATYAEAKAGFEAGATHTTHTYNAMRPLHHREAGTVGFALLETRLAGELIYDRIHVAPEPARLLIECKPADKVLAISDGTMAAGMPAGSRLSMWGLDAVVGEGEVRLVDGTLAGSAITLLDAFRNLATDFGPEVAIRATSLNPRAHLGLRGRPAVWLTFSPEYELIAMTDGRSNWRSRNVEA